MMLRRVLALAGMVAVCPAIARAADHADGPSATQSLMDLSGDITDVYAFTDANNVNLIMDVGTNATATSKFSNAVQYVFHVNGITGLTDTAPFSSTVVCTFDASQKISCWLQNGSKTVNYVTGDASATAGVASADGKMKVFAGPRNDPFFFNIQGFRAVTGYVAAHFADFATTLTAGGCPQLDKAGNPATVPSSSAVRGLLASQTDGTTPGVDDFQKNGTAAAPLGIATITGNILALVVSVPKTALNNNGAKPILGVWASTHK
jgi:hypothetical protein